MRPTIPVMVAATTLAIALAGALPAIGEPFGMVAHIPSQEIVDEMSELGVDWARIDFVWALVESERGVYDWSIYDDLVDRLETAGIRIFATLQGTPEWATEGSVFSGVPYRPGDWQEFCYQAARRYRGRVQCWGLWNEPNLFHFWEGNRDQYVNMIVVRGATAIRTADPDALIGGPDLAHLGSGQWDSWLEDILRRVGEYFDVATHHTYPSSFRADDVTSKLNDDSSYPWDPPSVRTVLNRAGWGERPVWLTETGLQSAPWGEAIQDLFYVALLDDWFDKGRSRSWLDRIFFYEIADSTGHADFTWGILEPPPGLRRKRAFSGYRNFITRARVDDAQIVSAEVPEFFRSAQSAVLSVELENTGGTSWSTESYRLYAEADATNWRFSGGELPPGLSIPPGETVTLELGITAPYTTSFDQPRSVRLVVRMERVGQWIFGQGLSRTLYLTNSKPPEFLMHPRSVTAEGGDSVSFTAVVSSASAAQFRWRRNSQEINDNSRYEGTQSRVLRIHSATADTVADYDCVVTNAAGRVISELAHLSLGGATGPSNTGRRASGRVGTTSKLIEQWIHFRQSGRTAGPGRRELQDQR